MGFLRASGGVSYGRPCPCKLQRFSPRKRRCFLEYIWNSWSNNVFSAQAEVFLNFIKLLILDDSFLRASGGVSLTKSPIDQFLRFSPRKRRCFLKTLKLSAMLQVFSAQAEVFLTIEDALVVLDGFLRASGGVSIYIHLYVMGLWFSPRKRRCFYGTCKNEH